MLWQLSPGSSCTPHGVRPILLSLRGHNSAHGNCCGRSLTTGGGKCCLTQLPFWSGPELPASQMAQPKSEDGGQASCSSPTHPSRRPAPASPRRHPAPGPPQSSDQYPVAAHRSATPCSTPGLGGIGQEIPGQAEASAAAGAAWAAGGRLDSASAGWLLSVTWCRRG